MGFSLELFSALREEFIVFSHFSFVLFILLLACCEHLILVNIEIRPQLYTSSEVKETIRMWIDCDESNSGSLISSDSDTDDVEK